VRGDLMFSWRLAMAPEAVRDYVAVHEAAHLVEMNHGPAFWKLVADLRPDWRTQRAWLRREGPGLHRFRFVTG
jgi:predicted metal-dependent hydrolase